MSIFLPGSYSIDSWNQWNEVANHSYDDWYGTGLATTWKWLWTFTGNYMCLFVVQMCSYWIMMALLMWQINVRTAGYWLTIGFGTFFCFIAQYVMRDSLTVLAWGIGAVLLIKASETTTRRRNLTIGALLLLVYGLWVRLNAVAALLPFLYVIVILLGGQRLKLWKRLLYVVGATVFFLVGIQVFVYKIQKANRRYPDYKLKLLDLSGISKLSGQNCFPPELTTLPQFSLDTLLAEYTPASIDDIYWPGPKTHIFPEPNANYERAVTIKWLSVIKHHPLYYLENRFTGFLYYLHIKRRFHVGEYWNVVTFWIQPDGPLPAKLEPSPLKDNLGKVYGFFDRTPLYDPWLWLLCNLAAFIWFAKKYYRRQDDLFWLTHAAIQLSGVLFILSQSLIYQHDRDFRYTYWNVIVALFALSGLFTKRQGAGFKPTP